MPEKYPDIGDAECLRRLHVFELAQLERLTTQQTRQARPARQAEDEAQREQAQVGALGRRGKPLRMRVDRHLHHQHGGGDQQHTGNRRQRRVDILHEVIDPAAEIAGKNAQRHAHRHRDQGRHQPDDQRRAHALEHLIENVLADLVGAEHMVIAAQGQDRQEDDQQDTERRQHGVPGEFRLAAPQRPPRLACPGTLPSRQVTSNTERSEQGRCRRQHDGQQPPLEHVEVASGFVVAQMRAAVLQTRKVTRRLHAPVGAARFDGFLGVGTRRQRRRIGLFVALAQRRGQRIEQRAHFDGIRRAYRWRLSCDRIAGRQTRTVMQGVEQADTDEDREHRCRHHARPTAPDPPPCRARQRVAPHEPCAAQASQHQQPEQRIGPEQDGLEGHRVMPASSQLRQFRRTPAGIAPDRWRPESRRAPADCSSSRSNP